MRITLFLSLLTTASCSVGWQTYYFMYPTESNVKALEFGKPDLNLYRGAEIPVSYQIDLPNNQIDIRVKLDNLSPSIELKAEVVTHVAGESCLHIIGANETWTITYVCEQKAGRTVDLVLTYFEKREVVSLSLILGGKYLLIDSF